MKCISIALLMMFIVTTYHYQDDGNKEEHQLQYLAADDENFTIHYQDLLIDQSAIFKIDNAAPGDSQTKYIKVANTGHFEMEYLIFFRIRETSVIEEVIYIEIEKLNEEKLQIPGTQIEDTILSNKKLKQDDEDIYKITMGIDEQAGNEYNRAEPLIYSIDILFHSAKAKQTHQQKQLDPAYFGPVDNKDWASIKNGNLTLGYPKIKYHNGWNLKKGRLYFNDQLIHDDPLISAPIGIKLDSLLADYPGYQLSAVTLNQENLLSDATNQWVETVEQDFSHLVYIPIGHVVGNQTNLNQYKLDPDTHHLMITITNDEGHTITFNLEIEVILTTNHIH
jgi:hypothetical protein